MKKLLLYTLFFSCLNHLNGQTLEKYHEYLASANKFIQEKNFTNAIIYFRAARDEVPDSTNAIDGKLAKVLGGIDALRAEAVDLNVQLSIESAKTKANFEKYIADAEIARGNYDLAFIHSLQAMKTIDTLTALYKKNSIAIDSLELSTLIPSIYETFGQSVYHYKRKVIDSSSVTLMNLAVSPKGKYFIGVGEGKNDKTAYIFDSKEKSIKLIKHKKTILNRRISTDENKFLSCSADGTAQLLDLKRDTVIHFKEHSDEVLGGTFSKDGNLIVTWSRDDTTLVWNDQGKIISTLGGHQGNVYQVAISPNEEQIVTRSSDQTAILWSKDGKLIDTLNKHTSYIYHILFSPSGNHILTCSADKTAILWNKNGELIAKLPHNGIVTKGVFSKNGQKIMTINQNNEITIWNFPKGQPKSPIIIKHDTPITDAMFSSNDTEVISIEQEKHINLWDVKTGIPIKRLERHKANVIATQLSEDGTHLLSLDTQGVAYLWNLVDGTVRLKLNQYGQSIPQFTNDGDYIISSIDGKKIEKTPIPATVYAEKIKYNLVQK